MNPHEPSRAEFAYPLASTRKKTLRWVGVALLVLAAGLGYWWWSSSRDNSSLPTPGGRSKFDPSARPQPVSAQPVAQGKLDVTVSALGTVTPRNVVTVRPRVDGQLMRVYFTEGQLVKAGDLLAQIDPRTFDVQLATASGQLERDLAQLKNAQADLERYKTLLGQDSIAKQQVDTQEALVRQYSGGVASDRAQIESARLQLSFARITAPISGRVGLRQLDAGNLVRASDANGLVVITEVQPINVVFSLPQDQLPALLKRLRGGAKLQVEARDRDGRNRLGLGQVVTVDNQIDATTGTVKVKSEFSNDDGALFPNQFVNVRLLVDTLDNALIVPTAAVQRGAPGNFVYRLKGDGTVAIVPVKLGASEGDSVAVVEGLALGDRVVVDGTDKLRDGAKVEVIDRNAPPAARAPAK